MLEEKAGFLSGSPWKVHQRILVFAQTCSNGSPLLLLTLLAAVCERAADDPSVHQHYLATITLIL